MMRHPVTFSKDARQLPARAARTLDEQGDEIRAWLVADRTRKG